MPEKRFASEPALALFKKFLDALDDPSIEQICLSSACIAGRFKKSKVEYLFIPMCETEGIAQEHIMRLNAEVFFRTDGMSEMFIDPEAPRDAETGEWLTEDPFMPFCRQTWQNSIFSEFDEHWDDFTNRIWWKDEN